MEFITTVTLYTVHRCDLVFNILTFSSSSVKWVNAYKVLNIVPGLKCRPQIVAIIAWL